MYGVGGTPLERRVLDVRRRERHGRLSAARAVRARRRRNAYWLLVASPLPHATPLNAFVKLPGLAAEVGLVLLLFGLVRALAGVGAARLAAAAYWLNPAALFDASILGYLDAQYVLPAVAALAAAVSGWPALGRRADRARRCSPRRRVLFIAPAVALAIWADRRAGHARSSALLSAAGGALAAVKSWSSLPSSRPADGRNMLQALGRLAHARHAVGQRGEPVVGDRLPAARRGTRYTTWGVGRAHRAGEDSRHPARRSTSAIRIRERSASC